MRRVQATVPASQPATTAAPITTVPSLKARREKLAHCRGKGGKKITVDRFNDNRQGETQRLHDKRRMDHNEKMATLHLKKRKYDAKYGVEGSLPAATPAISTAMDTKEDKQIQILLLQIKLAEMTRANTSSTSHLPQSPSPFFTDSSTPSSGVSMDPQAGSSQLQMSSLSHSAMPEYAPINGGAVSSLSGWEGNFDFTGSG